MFLQRLLAGCVALAAGLLANAQDASTPIPPELLQRIREKTDAIHPELVQIRRDIHMYPELSGEEKVTAALVTRRLTGLGLEVKTGVGGHGVVGVLGGGKPGPVVAYRADMDAVRSPVVGDPPYRSRVAGVKHVCGHDGHVAVGLGIATVLASVREDLPGTVKFIFQPAEENVRGARAMIEAGVLDDPAPEVIYAVHCTPAPVGTIACPPGVGLTGWRLFTIELNGLDGATQNIAAEVVAALNGLSTVQPPASAEAFAALNEAMGTPDGPMKTFVFVTSQTMPGDAPGRRIIQGQLRASDDAMYEQGRRDIEARAADVLRDKGFAYHVKFDERFPDMHSDPALVHAAIPAIKAMLGEDAVVMVYASAPFFGEDFALFQQRIPGAMFFLGTSNAEKGITALNHMPDYDIDEDALAVGAKGMSAVILDYMLTHPRE